MLCCAMICDVMSCQVISCYALNIKPQQSEVVDAANHGANAIFDAIFAPRIEDRWVSCSSELENNRTPSSSKKPPIFEDPSSSQNPQSSNGPPIFDLRLRKTKNLPSSIFEDEERTSPHFNSRSSASKIEEPLPSSIFDLGDRSEDRTEDGGATSSKMGKGFFEHRWVLRSSGSEERRAPQLRSSEPKKRRTSNLPPSRPDGRRTLFFFRLAPASDLCLAGSLRFPEVLIFCPIFHLEDRSEDRDRPSTPLRDRYVSQRCRGS